MQKGLSLIELMIVIVLFVILAGAAVYVFQAILLNWSSHQTRAGVDIDLDNAVEEIVRELREAKEVESAAGYDEIRFTKDESTYYIYYLYNVLDSYVPPPAFDQDSYQLRKATLTGGLSGAFAYGDGQIILSDVVPPGEGSDPETDLSEDAEHLITIVLKIRRADEIIMTKTQLMPRNL